MRNYDLSEEQVDLCWTDGSGDGGIDGFFTCINNNLLEPDTDLSSIKKNPIIDLYIFQCKFEKSFNENVLNKLNSTVQLILDNSKPLDSMRRSYSQDLLECAKLFRNAYFDRLPTLFPKLNIHYIYATYGKESRVDDLFPDRRRALEETTCGLFPNCKVDIGILGATQLIELMRTRADSTIVLPIQGFALSREEGEYGGEYYVVLCKMQDYYNRVLIDSNGQFQKLLFEANIRDYFEESQINIDIANTVRNVTDTLDFWWLNNGITILASDIKNYKKGQIALENIQIINGLQTSRSIFDVYSDKNDPVKINKDDRCILIKIIMTEDTKVRDRIIIATNCQNTVTPAMLIATEPLQRDIEEYFEKSGWYYERQKNHFINMGMTTTKIVSIHMLAQSVISILYKEPHKAKSPTELIKKEKLNIFTNIINFESLLTCVKIIRKVERCRLPPDVSKNERKNLKFHIGLNYIIKILKNSDFPIRDFNDLGVVDPTDDDIKNAMSDTINIAKQYLNDNQTYTLANISKSKSFTDHLIKNTLTWRAP